MEKVNYIKRAEKINRLLKENNCSGNALIKNNLIKKSEITSLQRNGYKYDSEKNAYVLKDDIKLEETNIKENTVDEINKLNLKGKNSNYLNRNCQLYFSKEELNLLDSLVIEAGFLSRSLYLSHLINEDKEKDIIKGNFEWNKIKVGFRFPKSEDLILMKKLAKEKGFGNKHSNYILELIKRKNIERQLSHLSIKDIEKKPSEYQDFIECMKFLIEGLKESNEKIIKSIETQFKFKISSEFIEEFRIKYTKLEES